MQGEFTTYTVTLARTGSQQIITAKCWRDALRIVGQPDACLVEHTGERACRISFDPESPQIIDVRTRSNNRSERVHWGLANVVNFLDMAAKGQEAES